MTRANLKSWRFSVGLLLWQLFFTGWGVLSNPDTALATFNEESADSCIHCHASLPDMRLRQPVQLWSSSVHAEVGNTCDGCHGGNPEDTTLKSMAKENNFRSAPKEDEIAEFCGKCHQELADRFQTSIHGQTQTQNCIGCHGSHTIRRISIDIINPTTCSGCHDYEEPGKLKAILQNLQAGFHRSQGQLTLISGFSTESLRRDLERSWNEIRKVRMISHTFDLDQVRAEAQKAEETLSEIDQNISHLVNLVEERKIWGYVSVPLFLLLGLVTFLYNRQSAGAD